MLLGALSVCVSGCSSTRLTRFRMPSSGWNLFTPDPKLSPAANGEYSESTIVGLRTLSLEKTVRKDPKKAAAILEENLRVSSKLDLAAILAEVAFCEAQNLAKGRFNSEESSKESLEWYVRSAKYAYDYLFSPKWENARNPYAPAFQNVCRIFNESTEAILRHYGNRDGEIQFDESFALTLHLPEGPLTLPISMRSREWKFADFSNFLIASDFEVTGLKNRYRRYGLGVPLVARVNDIHQKPHKYSYCLQEMCVPLTVFLSFDETNVPHLEFIDTMEHSQVQVAQTQVPLGIDFTTPLAYSFELTVEKNALDGATLGLLNPDSLLEETEDGSRQLKGIYMPQAYDPEKIPVVMVHGLWSSAMTWMEMYNTLNNFAPIQKNYQFWFYFYPNGQPFWVSASQLRTDLEALRNDLDPERKNPRLDQMILTGHSMGGLVAILQTLDSKERFWNLISSVPPEDLPGSAESNQEVARWFHTTPNPSISCVICMGTPFQGSGFANSTTRGLTGIVGKKASLVEKNLKQFQKENHEFIQNDELLNYFTALDSLQKSNCFWDALLACDHPSWVSYVNVISRLKDDESQSDGVVSLESASLPWADEEIFITSLHREIPNDAEAILAVAHTLAKRLDLGAPEIALAHSSVSPRVGAKAEIQDSAPSAAPSVSPSSIQTGRQIREKDEAWETGVSLGMEGAGASENSGGTVPRTEIPADISRTGISDPFRSRASRIAEPAVR